MCLLVDLYNWEIVGQAASDRKVARLVKAAFTTVPFPLFDIEVFRTDRCSELGGAQVDEPLEVFGIERSLSGRG